MQFLYCLLIFNEYDSSLNEKIKKYSIEPYKFYLGFLLCKFLFLLIDVFYKLIKANFNELIFNLLFLFDVSYLLILLNEYNNIYENYYEYNPQFVMLFSYFFGMYCFSIFIIIFKDMEKFYSNKNK